MTAPSQGRGRPALLNDAARAQYLAARRTGDNQEKAAAAAGVAARTVRDLRRTDPDFRALDDTAAKEGRRARTLHGESRYINLGCRCGICTKDATEKRVARREKEEARGAAAGSTSPGKEAPVVAISPPDQGSSQVFPLARAS